MSRIDRRFGFRILVVNRQADLDLERHAVAHAAFLAFLLIVLVLQADRLAAVLAKLRTHGIEGAALVTERFAGSERIDLDRRAAVLTVRAQVVETFEAAALTLPVADLILDEVERRGLAKIRDRKDRLKHSLQSGVLALFRQQIHLQKAVVRLALNLDQIRDCAPPSRSWKSLRARAPDSCVVPILCLLFEADLQT